MVAPGCSSLSLPLTSGSLRVRSSGWHPKFAGGKFKKGLMGSERSSYVLVETFRWVIRSRPPGRGLPLRIKACANSAFSGCWAIGILCTPVLAMFSLQTLATVYTRWVFCGFHYLALTVNREITTKVILYPVLYTKSLVNLAFINQPGLHWGVV